MSFVVATIATLMVFSCEKAMNAPINEETIAPSHQVLTKAAGDKTPSILCYVETNDVNPLNALCCRMPDGEPFIDYVVLFASNIHSTTVNNETQPTLYYNPQLTPIMDDPSTYIQPLQDDGQKVLLGVLGDWAGLGLANMTITQAQQFATILAYAVGEAGLDGVSFDDEYSGSNTVNNYSYSTIISYYRQLRPNDIIHVFDWGGTYSISSTAAATINYAGHGYFYYNYFVPYTYSSIPGMTAARWSPISLNLGATFSTSQLSTISSAAASAGNGGYGQIQLFNLRKCDDVCPKPVFQAIADGLDWGTLYCNVVSEDKPTPVPGGEVITYAMATAN